MAERWMLKDSENDFQVTEGRFAYHTFKHGEVYDAIPEEYGDRFEAIAIIEKGGDEE